MEKVLITGANGFLGANLARMLSAKYEVKILVRKNADLKALEGLQLETYYGDINHAEDVFKAVRGCSYVIHTAGITEQSGITLEQYEQINVTATKLVAQACVEYKIVKLIYVSTANTIGPGSRNDPGTELNGFYYFKANSGYINSKYLGQQYILEQVMKKELPAVVVNPTFMIGAYDSKPSSGRLILYGLRKKIILYPPGGKNFVHIRDVCMGIASAIEIGKTGNCYLLAGENLTYRNFFKILNKVSGENPLLIRIPPLILTLAASFCALLKMLNHKPQKLTSAGAYMLCQKNYYSGNKSERELGLKYHSVAEAVSDAYHWFDTNNNLQKRN